MSDKKSALSEGDKICGIIMPISAIDGCPASHWSDVYTILSGVIGDAGFTASMVSSGNDSDIIQKRIVQNLYENPLVICDVSGKNPNVMFELGMRLAFDRPTIVIKDDKTTYTFDTSPIEHLEYPRDLRYNLINSFKDQLAKKVEASIKKSQTSADHATFLKSFGEFTVAKISTKEISQFEFLVAELRELSSEVRQIANRRDVINSRETAPERDPVQPSFRYALDITSIPAIEHSELLKNCFKLEGLKFASIKQGNSLTHLLVDVKDDSVFLKVDRIVERMIARHLPTLAT